MFIKLFKYDFKAVFFKIAPFAICLLVLAVTLGFFTRLSYYYYDKVFIFVIATLVFLLFGCLAFVVYTYIVCLLRYVNSVFKNAGYLTHTLPVSKHKIIISQILNVIIYIVLSSLYVELLLLISSLTKEVNIFREFIFSLFTYARPTIEENIIGITAAIISSISGTIILYLCIALGHIHSKNKVIYSIVYMLCIQYGIEIIKGIIIYLFLKQPTIIPEFFYLIAAVGDTYIGTQIASIVFNTLLIVGGYISIYIILNKRLNLE